MEMYFSNTKTFTQGRNCVRKKNQGGNGAEPHWTCECPIHIILITVRFKNFSGHSETPVKSPFMH